LIVIGVTIWDGSFKYLTPFLYTLKHLDYPKEELGLVFSESCIKKDPTIIKRYLSRAPYRFVKLLHSPTHKWRAKAIAMAQNLIREEMLIHDADFLFLLESDNPPPPHALKTLLEINSEDTPITAGGYARRGTRDPMISKWKSSEEPYGDNEEESFWNLYNKGGVVEVDKTGFGCILIRRSVLEKYPFCDPIGTASSDSTTCVKWRKEGLKILCDTRLMVPHLADEIKLNMGCGKAKKWDYVNIDMSPDVRPDMVLDVTRHRLPFDNDTVDRIVAEHFLEHIGDELIGVIREWHRVCRNGAIIHIVVPNAEHSISWAAKDPTHKRLFVPATFHYFDIDQASWRDFGSAYGIPPFKIDALEPKENIVCDLKVIKGGGER